MPDANAAEALATEVAELIRSTVQA